MIGIRTVGASEAAERFRLLAQRIPDLARRTVELASILIRKKLVERMMARNVPRHPFWGKGSPQGAFLGSRTGMTAKRISPARLVVRRGNIWEAAVGSPDSHVRLHEHGGTVQGSSPKGFLRIPTAAAQSLSGAEQQRFAGRSLRDVPGVFLIRSKSGNLWAVEREKKKSLTFLYLLKRSAHYRPRGIFAAVAAEMQAEFAQLGAVQMQTAIASSGLK